MSDEEGSGSLLGLALVGSIFAVLVAALPLYMGLSVQNSLAGSADAAALAGADVASGIASGIPCDAASRVALANHAEMDGCVVDGLVVTVHLNRQYLGLSLVATASAGPPGAVTN